MEHRPTLSILHVVVRLLYGSKSTQLLWAPCCKRPFGLGTGLQTTLLQDLVSTATNGSWASQSTEDSSGSLQDHVL
jgi:hypothetical protein